MKNILISLLLLTGLSGCITFSVPTKSTTLYGPTSTNDVSHFVMPLDTGRTELFSSSNFVFATNTETKETIDQVQFNVQMTKSLSGVNFGGGAFFSFGSFGKSSENTKSNFGVLGGRAQISPVIKLSKNGATKLQFPVVQLVYSHETGNYFNFRNDKSKKFEEDTMSRRINNAPQRNVLSGYIGYDLSYFPGNKPGFGAGFYVMGGNSINRGFFDNTVNASVVSGLYFVFNRFSISYTSNFVSPVRNNEPFFRTDDIQSTNFKIMYRLK